MLRVFFFVTMNYSLENTERTFKYRWLSFLTPYTEADSEEELIAQPLPTCLKGKCFCPRGYSYDSSQHACLSSNTPGYNYSIQGGGHEDTGNAANKKWVTNVVLASYNSFTLEFFHALLIADLSLQLQKTCTTFHTQDSTILLISMSRCTLKTCCGFA